MIIRTTVGDNFIEKVQNIFNDQSRRVKINVDVKRDCMTYAFKIIFVQEHVKKLFWSRYERNERYKCNNNNDRRQRTVKPVHVVMLTKFSFVINNANYQCC